MRILATAFAYVLSLVVMATIALVAILLLAGRMRAWWGAQWRQLF